MVSRRWHTQAGLHFRVALGVHSRCQEFVEDLVPGTIIFVKGFRDSFWERGVPGAVQQKEGKCSGFLGFGGMMGWFGVLGKVE